MTSGRSARLLIVTAVSAERDAIAAAVGATHAARLGPYDALEGSHTTLLAGGVGPAAAAAATATMLALAGDYALAVSAGIAGGFPGRASIGDVVEATVIVAADLGAQTASGFVSISELGFGPSEVSAASLAIPGAVTGPVLTVSTVTGGAARAVELAARGGYAEAMEGFGVAEAAQRYGLPVGELRAISNVVGVRDRASWDVPGALAALSVAARSLREVLS